MRAYVLPALALAIFAWTRARLWQDGIPNPDIAGITYEADRILAAQLPYVATAEIKPPGAFFLVAAIFAAFGRGLDALQVGHTLWLLFGAGGVLLAARSLWPAHEGEREPARRWAPAVAVALYLVYAPTFSFNYTTWATPPMAWALGLALAGNRRREGAAAWLTHLGAGLAGAWAFAIKQPAALVALPLLWVLWREPPRRRLAVLGAWLLGATAGLAPVVALYASRGAAGALASGLLPWSVAREYVVEGGAPVGWALPLQVLAQLVRTFPLPSACILPGLAAWAMDRRARRSDPTRSFLALAVLGAVLGAGLGGARYYLHYLVAYVPALALAAAHPGGLALLARGQPRRLRLLLRGAVLAALLWELGAALAGQGHRYTAMARHLQDGRTAAQAAGEHIRSRTDPGATIQAWGWTAWPVYFWADRAAPGRIYKPMGLVTTFNRNGAFAQGPPPELRRGPLADELLRTLREHPPAYFVYSPSYVRTFGAERDPLERWPELAEWLAEHYEPDALYGDLLLLRRVH